MREENAYIHTFEICVSERTPITTRSFVNRAGVSTYVRTTVDRKISSVVIVSAVVGTLPDELIESCVKRIFESFENVSRTRAGKYVTETSK